MKQISIISILLVFLLTACNEKNEGTPTPEIPLDQPVQIVPFDLDAITKVELSSRGPSLATGSSYVRFAFFLDSSLFELVSGNSKCAEIETKFDAVSDDEFLKNIMNLLKDSKTSYYPPQVKDGKQLIYVKPMGGGVTSMTLLLKNGETEYYDLLETSEYKLGIEKTLSTSEKLSHLLNAQLEQYKLAGMTNTECP